MSLRWALHLTIILTRFLIHLIGYHCIEKGSALNLRIDDLNFISIFDHTKSQIRLNPVIYFT